LNDSCAKDSWIHVRQLLNDSLSKYDYGLLTLLDAVVAGKTIL